jgi:hypothetical protein
VASYYRRQLRTCEQHSIKDGVWLDRFHADEDSGRKRSLDVLITRTASTSAVKDDQEQGLMVELVAIEVNVPRE